MGESTAPAHRNHNCADLETARNRALTGAEPVDHGEGVSGAALGSDGGH